MNITKLSVSIASIFVLIVIVGNITSSQAVTLGNISGQVTDLSSNPLQNIQVSIHNAENGIVVAIVATDSSGHYDTGDLPDGDYRVHFEDMGGVVPPAPEDHHYVSTFFDTEFDFCSSDIVTVVTGSTATADQSLTTIPPVVIEPHDLEISGHVSDSSDSTPLEGIKVSIKSIYDTSELVSVTTDTNGDYSASPRIIATPYKVRFSDPSGNYIPAYSGASGGDNFCAGTTFPVDSTITANEQMVKLILTPSEQTDALIEETNSLGLPPDVVNSFVSPLSQASELLADNNVNNDRSACGKLTAFINQVESQNGKTLSSAQVSQLTDSAISIKSSLDC